MTVTAGILPQLTDEQKRARIGRINSLTDDDRRMMLIYLDGYAPQVIDAGFERLAGRRPAAQITEASPAPCLDHRPVFDSAAGWYCAACGSGAHA